MAKDFKAKLIAAAYELIAEAGSDSVPIKTIREHVGASNGAAYYHFNGPEHFPAALYLSAALYDDLAVRRAGRVRAMIQRHGRDHWQCIHALLEGEVTFARQSRSEAIVWRIIGTNPKLPLPGSPGESANRQRAQAIVACFGRPAKINAKQQVDTDLLLTLVDGAADQLMARAIAHGAKADLEFGTNDLAAAICRGLGIKEASKRSKARLPQMSSPGAQAMRPGGPARNQELDLWWQPSSKVGSRSSKE